MTDFQSSYAQQKEAYYDMMRQTQQASPDKQPELIQHLLDMNSELAKLVRDYIASSPDKTDLTPELKKIQKEFLKLQTDSDRKKTLEIILNEDEHKRKAVHWQYNLLLFFLSLSVLTIVYMIIRLGAQKMLSSMSPTQYNAIS